MIAMAIVVPIIGALYLIAQIQRRDLRGWQHYACLTSLFFLISILFLVGSGNVKSFGLAGNTIEVVDQKLVEIRALTEQNQRMAKATIELVAALAATPLTTVTTQVGDMNQLRPRVVELLKASGFSDGEVQKFIDELNKKAAATNSP